MPTIKVDSDGIAYWDIYLNTRLDYTANWNDWLSDVGDTIASSVWSVDVSGLTISSATVSGSKASVWVITSAGNAGTNYLLVSKIFTLGDRQEKMPFRIKVGNI